MADAGSFLFVGCQLGAERALKDELAVAWPAILYADS